MAFGNYYDYLIFDLKVERVPAAGFVDGWVRTALPKYGIRILDSAFTSFESPVAGGHAYTYVYVLSASHLAIHTAPEHGWVHIAFALCNGSEWAVALEHAVRIYFKPLSLNRTQRRCGVVS